jgi:hypothetical protein
MSLAADPAEPLVCRFLWTEQESWKVSLYHWKKSGRWPFLGLAYLIFGGMIVFSAWNLLKYGFEVSSLVLILLSIFLLLLVTFAARWRHRRKFLRRPDRDALLEYRVSDEGIAFKAEGLGEGQTPWAAVFKVLRVPDGVLVYPHEQVMYWLPDAGFPSADAIAELDRLLREKVSRYDSL